MRRGTVKDLFKSLASGIEGAAEILLDAEIEERAGQFDRRAKAALASGDHLAARQLWEQALQLDPRHPAAVAGLKQLENRARPAVTPPTGRDEALLFVSKARQAHEAGDDSLAITLLKQALASAGGDDELTEGILHTIGLLETRVSPSSPVKPEEVKQPAPRPPTPTASWRVFVSYAHVDREWIDLMRPHLEPLGVWDDTKLRAGDAWEREIEEAMARVEVAILLVSADFLASTFIRDRELPALRSRYLGGDGLRIVPVIARPCRLAEGHFIKTLQAANLPERPLSTMEPHEVDQVFADVAEGVARTLGI